MSIDLRSQKLVLESISDHKKEEKKKPNFFELNDRLFLNASINEVKSTLLIDTGADEILNISERFYKFYQKQLPLLPDSLDIHILSGRIHQTIPIRLRVLDKPKINIANKELHLTDRLKGIYVDNRGKYVGSGTIGMPGLHLLGNKICFDFLSFED